MTAVVVITHALRTVKYPGLWGTVMAGPEECRRKDVGIHIRQTWVHIPVLTLTSCVSWGKLLDLSEP